MQTLSATIEKFKAYGEGLEETEQSQEASQKPSLESKSQKPSLDFKSLESSLTTRRRPNIARTKAKESKFRESLESSLESNIESSLDVKSLDVKSLESSLDFKSLASDLESSLDVKSLESSLDFESLDSKSQESSQESSLAARFYSFAQSELERLQRVLAVWRESGKPQRATERILHQMAKFSNFCRQYEAISTAPIFGVNNQKSNLLPVVYNSHALKLATKPGNIGLVGLNPETAQTIGANLAARQTDKGIFYKQKGHERQYKRILKDLATNGNTATIKASRKEPREAVFKDILLAEECFLAISPQLQKVFTPENPKTVKKQLRLNCAHGLKLRTHGRVLSFVRQLESALLGAPKQGLIATWLVIEKPNNACVKHDRNFEALRDAAKIFTNGYQIAFCQISRIGGTQGTYKAAFAKADKRQALTPIYEASETSEENGNLRVYTLKLKHAEEGK